MYGSNMQETSEILLPDGSKITEGIDSDRDGEWFSFTMPAGMNASGSIEAVNANGRIKSPACFNERGGIFLDFDDNGKMGSWSATYGSADLESDPSAPDAATSHPSCLSRPWPMARYRPARRASTGYRRTRRRPQR